MLGRPQDDPGGHQQRAELPMFGSIEWDQDPPVDPGTGGYRGQTGAVGFCYVANLRAPGVVSG